jgi:hypothetical protein
VITPVAGPAPSPTACEGAMIYTFTYTDCSGKLARLELHLHDRYTGLHFTAADGFFYRETVLLMQQHQHLLRLLMRAVM